MDNNVYDIVGTPGESNRGKLTEQKELFSGFRLRVIENHYDDDLSPYEGLAGTPAATCVITKVENDEELFLITEESMPMADERVLSKEQQQVRTITTPTAGTLFKFSGGMVDINKGETPEDAAHRETAEEVGITPKNIRKLGQPFYFPARTVERDHIYHIDDFDLTDTNREATEDIVEYWVTWQQICQLIVDGDPRTQNAHWLDIVGLIAAHKQLEVW